MNKTRIIIIAVLIFGLIGTVLYRNINPNILSTNVLNKPEADTLKLTFIVGKEINYYEGILVEKSQIKIANSRKSEIVKIVKGTTKEKIPYEIIVKPSYEPNSIQTFMDITGWLYEEGIEHSKKAELNENEVKFLGFENPPNLLAGEPEPLKLYLPKDGEDELEKRISKVSIEHLITVILYGNSGIYVYEKANLAKARQLDYKAFRSYPNRKRKADKSLFVVIKPNRTSTYKNTVDILDEMSINQIRDYAMIDISDKEEKFIDSVLNR